MTQESDIIARAQESDAILLEAIENYRILKNLTQTQLAEQVGVAQSQLSMTRSNQREIGLALLKGLYKNAPELRLAIDNWLAS